jgi:hypothetical protein
MMKTKVFTLLFGICIAGCTTQNPTDAPQTTAVADDYFFPQTNGLQYTYSNYSTVTPDTSTYQVIVNAQYGSYTRLQKHDVSQPSTDVLYFYKTKTNSDGIIQCLMSREQDGSDGIVALQGLLDVGSSWFANDAQTIKATVMGRYDEYILPGHEQKYYDVVVVKYVDNEKSADVYEVRYFAREFGLILERTIIGQLTEISNLQLISRTKTTTTDGNGKDPSRWYDRNARYSIAPKINDEEDK